MNRKLSIAAIITGALAIIGELCALDLPSFAWFFSMGKTFGWVSSTLLVLGGFAGLVWLPRDMRWTPVTLLRFRRFRSIRRGLWSLRIIMLLIVVALLDQAIVGRRALLVSYEGKTFYPAFVKHRYQAKDFGLPGEQEVNYRELKKLGTARVIMPLVTTLR